MEKKFNLETTSFSLHIMAMIFMFCDHLWGTIVPGNDWLTCVGRIAFPIYAFMIVEGYFHTRNVKKYAGRLFVFAFISQIPFSLMLYKQPFVQGGNLNVYVTLFLGLLAVTVLDACIDKYKNNPEIGLQILIPGIVFAIIAMYVAEFLHTDYGSFGVLVILLFYIFRNKPIFLWLSLWWSIEQFSDSTEMYALYALIPIFLHNHKKGPGLKYLFYIYYPLHILVLFVLNQFVL